MCQRQQLLDRRATIGAALRSTKSAVQFFEHLRRPRRGFSREYRDHLFGKTVERGKLAMLAHSKFRGMAAIA